MTQPAPVRKGLRAPSRAIRYDTARGAVAEQVPVRDTLIDLVQTDALLPAYLKGQACSNLLGAELADTIELREGGAPGASIRALSITTEPLRRWIYMGSVEGEPGQVLWDAGSWTVRFNVATVTAGDGLLESCHICRVDQVGVNKGTVAKTTDLNISLTLGVKSWTIQGVQTVGASTDRIQISLGMRKATAPAASIWFWPNQIINTPILRVA